MADVSARVEVRDESCTALDDGQRAAVREQLERIIWSPAFRNGKRYPGFLKYIVEQTLEGRSAALKERTVGIAVFERDPDYDTNSDHVVRSAAAEVRKRLAQYYQQTNREAEIRIEVPTGSYVPQFRFPEEVPPAEEVVAVPETRDIARPAWRRVAVWVQTCAALVALVGWVMRPGETALDRFWNPVLAGPTPVLVCIANNTRLQALDVANSGETAASPEVGDLRAMTHQVVHMEDVLLLGKVVSGIVSHKGSYRILTTSATAYADLQEGPAVLLGAMNNDWSRRVLEKLRFRFVRPANGGPVAIVDAENPKAAWSAVLTPGANYQRGFGGVVQDYALVGRFRDPQTNRMVVVAAGLLGFGSVGAGTFVSDETAIRTLETVAPREWKSRNLEAVLAVDVVKGVAGPPHIVATHFW